MNTEEKLERFRGVVGDDAESKAKKELAAVKEQLKDELETYEDAQEEAMKADLAKEAARLKGQINRRIQETRESDLKDLAKREDEIRGRIFARAKEKLEEFRNSEEYAGYLVRKAEEALAAADGTKVEIYLAKEDIHFQNEILKATGIKAEESAELKSGGIIAALPEKGIRFNDNWAEALKRMEADFRFEGGLD